MTQKIKYGIIGAGSMGREHIRNIAIIEEAEVVGLSDPHNNSLQESLSLLGNDIATFNNHNELVNATFLSRRLFSLPSFNSISNNQVNKVIQSLVDYR